MPAPFSSPVFVVKITDISAAPEYQFVEVWDDGTGALVEKVGGRYGNATNPGVAVTGATFAVNAIVWCRQASGAGGLSWELYPLPTTTASLTISGTDNHAVRMDGASAIQDSLVVIDDVGVIACNGVNSNGAVSAQGAITSSNAGVGTYLSIDRWAPYSAPGVFEYGLNNSNVTFLWLDSTVGRVVTNVKYSVQNILGVIVDGGTVTTGGMNFVGGLYISGTAAAGDTDGGTW